MARNIHRNWQSQLSKIASSLTFYSSATKCRLLGPHVGPIGWAKNLTGPVVRLHAHPMDWLEAGCTGVCHIEPISRKALERPSHGQTGSNATTSIPRLEAWDRGFGGEDDELKAFEIDDSPYTIRSYFEEQIKWRTSRMEAEARCAFLSLISGRADIMKHSLKDVFGRTDQNLLKRRDRRSLLKPQGSRRKRIANEDRVCWSYGPS